MQLAELKRPFRTRRGYFLLLLHLAVFAFSYWLAFALRFDFVIPAESWQLMTATIAWVVAIKLLAAWWSGTFHGWLRYVTFHDLIALGRAAVVAFLVIIAVDHFLLAKVQIPRSVVVLDAAIGVMLLGGIRAAGRLARDHLWPLLHMHLNRGGYRRALLVGANSNSVSLAGQIHARHDLMYRIVGLLDDDLSLVGARLGGLPVVGSPDDAAKLADVYSVDELLVIDGALPGARLRNLMEQCRAGQVPLKVIPNVNNLVSGEHLVGPRGLRLRDVDINDVLRRDPVELDATAMATFLANRVVLVTGAGGSIGAEICRQVLQFNPRALVLVERAENNLFQIDRELRELGLPVAIHPCLADITDPRRMRKVFENYAPQVIFHAAAHKHVPMMEFNPGEALKNNVFGTRLLTDLADEFELESFVLISTDKAVNPTSVMGLSKQLAERYVHAMSQSSRTRFVAVRFGNVLGSVGSVVPIFQEQIRNGGPVTVTHPEMRRYFMTIPEASQLVIQAGAMGNGGEIFVLDMGEPVRIVDLARDLIRLSGLEPDEIEIEFTGIRPGEKLYEELYLDEEQTLPTNHPKLRVAFHRPYSVEEVQALFDELTPLVNEAHPLAVRQRLLELVPDFVNHPAPRVAAPPGEADLAVDVPTAEVAPRLNS